MKKHIFKVSALSALAVTGVVTPIIAFATSCNKPPVVTDDYVETVTKANQLLDGKTLNTMSDMLSELKKNNIDLQSKSVSSSNAQYVWDKPQNKIFLLKNDDTVFYKPEGFTPSENKASIWKMVKAKSPTKLFSSKSNGSVYADQFDETTQYSQYLRDGEAFSSSLSFCSGLDTGSHEKLELTFKQTEKINTPVVINTLKSSLKIESSTEVEHYGNLTELNVKLANTETVFKEHGSVDAAIVLEQGKVNLEPTSQVNTVIVNSNTTETVKIEVATGSDIGTIKATNDTIASKLKDEVVSGEGEQGVGDIGATSELPKEDGEFYSGDGTENSPWCIKTKDQLNNFAKRVKDQNFPTVVQGQSTWFFNLIADIDYENNNWTAVGTDEKPFKGIFNGCGFTIKNIKCIADTIVQTVNPEKKNHVGFFGNIVGTRNYDYDTRTDVQTIVDPITKVWDSENKKLITDNIVEGKYTTVVKNLTIDNVTSIDTTKYYVGGIAGAANHVYFGNCKVTSGNIMGWKHVGGIAGTMGGCICQDCTVGDNTSNLTITATEYSAGGIAGSTGHSSVIDAWSCFAFVNCLTTNKVVVSLPNATGGAIGGLVGDNQSARCCVYDHCTNNALIQVTSKNESEYVTHVGGIAGFGQNVSVIANCVNNGAISILNNSYAEYIGGITSHANDIILVNNINNGSLSGHAVIGMAGVSAGLNDSGAQLTNNKNTGKLTNTGGAQSKTEEIYFDWRANN